MAMIYFGYDFFYNCLETVISEGQEVKKIYTYQTDNKYNFNEKILEIAKHNGIPITNERITKEELDSFAEGGCEHMLVAAYPYRVPVSEKIKAVNIHPTLLPEGRGPWPLPHIILNSLTRSGVTLHKITENIDGGDILLQNSFTLTDHETLESLSCKCQLLAPSLVRRYLSDSDKYWNNAIAQSGGSYWPRPSDAAQELNWEENVEEIERKIRAYGKLDSWAKFEGKEWLIQDATVWEDVHSIQPGTVVHKTNREYLIAAKDGYVCLRFFNVDA